MVDFASIPQAEQGLKDARQRVSDRQAFISEQQAARATLTEQAKAILDNLGDAVKLAKIRGELAARQELLDSAGKQRDQAEKDVKSILEDMFPRLRGNVNSLRAALAALVKANDGQREDRLREIDYQERITANGRAADKEKLQRLKDAGGHRVDIEHLEQRLGKGGHWSVEQAGIEAQRGILERQQTEHDQKLARLKARIAAIEGTT